MEGFPYAGMGNSTNKKDAQSNAARDFCQYLVRQGQMKAEGVPAMGKTQVSFDGCSSVEIVFFFVSAVHFALYSMGYIEPILA